jgi:hypothetical protein
VRVRVRKGAWAVVGWRVLPRRGVRAAPGERGGIGGAKLTVKPRRGGYEGEEGVREGQRKGGEGGAGAHV